MAVGYRRNRCTLALVFILVSFVVVLHMRDGFRDIKLLYRPASNFNHQVAGNSLDYDSIRSLNLSSSNIDFRRHCFTVKQQKGLRRQSLASLELPLLTSADRIAVAPSSSEAEDYPVFPPCHDYQTIHVPLDSPNTHAKTGMLMLGTSTFLDRLSDSLPEMSRWLSNTDTELLVVLRDSPFDDQLQAVKAKAATLKIKLSLISASELGEAESNFALATHLHSRLGPQTRWVGIIDDDTFFLSLPRVLEALAPYDPTLPWYIGALSERHLGINTEGFKAWGGAGIFLSPPLLTKLSEHSDECMTLADTWGDAMWRDCLFKITSPTVQLTRLPGLNQLDMFESMAGWYESGPDPLLTIHHWKSWHQFPVPVAHIVTDVAGVDSFLQRYKAQDSVILTNGYSIVHYPNGVPDLRLAEGTMFPYPGSKMPEHAGEFRDSLGALRPALKEGVEKVSWKFVTAVNEGNGCVLQFYVRKATTTHDEGHITGQDEVDSVIELDWCDK